MWHVDEGTLHAYLDERERPGAGALDEAERERVAQHVAACATCAARLAAQTRVRAAAAGILSSSAPRELAVPEFPAQAAAARAPKRAAPWRQLAWAATLVLAVGAGWFGSELWRAQPAERAVPREAAVEEVEQAAQQSAAADLGAPQVDAASPAGSGAAANPAAGQSGVEPAERAEAVASLDHPIPAAAPAAREVAPEENRVAVAQAQPRPVVTEPPVAVEQMAAAKRAAPPPAAAPAPAPLVATGAVAGAARLLETREQQRAAALQQLRVTAAEPVSWPEHGYPGDADVAWIPLVPELAARLLRDSLYVLPGAAIERLALSGDGTRVLVVQRQPEGGEVELVQWRTPAPAAGVQADAASKPLEARIARDGRSYVVVERGGVTIALKAPVGENAAALAGRLERRVEPGRRP